MARRAVFLDRDNTIIDDPGYLSDPAGVKLLPGVELAIKSFAQAGFKVVVVTNQSGIARGMLTEQMLDEIHDEMRRRLTAKGARIDGIYYCPYHPEGTVESYAKDSEMRKPRPGMLLKAAKEMNIDLAASWMIGDSPRDIEAGKRAGCKTIRIRLPKNKTNGQPDEPDNADFYVRNLVDAARVVMREVKKPTVAAPQSSQTASASAAARELAAPTPDASPSKPDPPAKPDRPGHQRADSDNKSRQEPGNSRPGNQNAPPAAEAVQRDRQSRPTTSPGDQKAEYRAEQQPPAQQRPEPPQEQPRPDESRLPLAVEQTQKAPPPPNQPNQPPSREDTMASQAPPEPQPREDNAAQPTRQAPAPPTDDPEIHRGQDERLAAAILRQMQDNAQLAETEPERFHLSKVAAGMLQFLAAGVLINVLRTIFVGADALQAILWALVAIVLQMMALTFYIMWPNQ